MSASDNPVVLHIGVHKTGSTALQSTLAAARPQLRALGILYPGRDEAHHAAAWAVTGFSMGFGDEATTVKARNWPNLVRQAQAHQGPVMISSEFFGRMRAGAVAKVVAELGAQRLQVMFGVRRLADLLPSSWQQYLKSGLTVSYKDWLRDVLTNNPPTTTKGFWHRADFAALVRRWSAVLPPGQMTAVVLSPEHRGLLYRTTEQMLELPPDFLEPYRTSSRENRSMTAPEAEAVRRINVAVRDTMGWQEYATKVRHGLIRDIVATRVPPPDEPRLTTPKWALEKALRRQTRDHRALTTSGIVVRGDTEYLLTRPRAAGIVPVTEIPADIVELVADRIAVDVSRPS